MTRPGSEIVANGKPLPVTYADRERVIRTLKAALAQGRLTEDEHHERTAQASVSRSRAELAALTADLPDGITALPPTARDVRIAVGVIIAAAGVIAAILAWGPDNAAAFLAFYGRHRRPDRGPAHNGGPDHRRTASEAVRRAAAARANPRDRGRVRAGEAQVRGGLAVAGGGEFGAVALVVAELAADRHHDQVVGDGGDPGQDVADRLLALAIRGEDDHVLAPRRDQPAK